MSPFLTGQGRWIFATGALFVLFGAILRQPLLVVLGQIPFLVLFASLVALLPAARALDRRQVQLSLEPTGDGPGLKVLRKGREESLPVWVDNASSARLYTRQLSPMTGGHLQAAPSRPQLVVGGGEAQSFALTVEPTGVGRAGLQGFDLVIGDRWGLVAARDYLPCVQVFCTYPTMRAMASRRRLSARPTVVQAVSQADKRARAGTDLRELRDYQPGDPLRTVAWKATVRQRRLITRDYEDERTHGEYIALDISSSMRAGRPLGAKFEHAIAMTAQLSAHHLEAGRPVGLWTFDGAIYGQVSAAPGKRQGRHIQRHLAGLNSVVGEGRTLLDGEDLEAALADYLLVQERLDFRRGQGLRGKVDSDLLRRWVASRLAGEAKKWGGRTVGAGVVDDTKDVLRRYFRLRALPLDPPAEVDAGEKLSGFQAVLKAVLATQSTGGHLTIISDLCGLSGAPLLEKMLGLIRRRQITVDIIAPYSPLYRRDDDEEGSLGQLVSDLFNRAERRERMAVAEELQAMGVAVTFVGPDHVGS